MDPRAVSKPLWLLAGSGADQLRALNVTLADVPRAVPREPGARDRCLPMIGTSGAGARRSTGAVARAIWLQFAR